ncbi:hypothetical protein GCM10010446_08180 [Streptomyces enissocaesilis]|uniref:Secreted protein n=1 Tax=Streptomyces enissocaesilis TaxID=332589 RepID=A0ABN3WTE3_9ACTN
MPFAAASLLAAALEPASAALDLYVTTTFSTGAVGSVVMGCEAGAGAGFGEGAAGAAASATEEVATTPAIVALAATTDMSLRLEPFKVFPLSTDDVHTERGRAAREPWCGVGAAVRSSWAGSARAPPPALRPLGQRP